MAGFHADNLNQKQRPQKKVKISNAIFEGDDAARNKWPLIANPHIGLMARHWSAVWILEHRKLCKKGCEECKPIKNFMRKRIKVPKKPSLHYFYRGLEWL